MGKLAVAPHARQRNRLVVQSGAVAPPTTPVAGSWGWWDATVGVTGGSTVTQWNDQSGNARHLTPGAAGSPSSGTRTHNSLNVIDFDGTNDGIGLTGALGFVMTNHTLFFVGGQDDTGVNCGLISIYNNANHDYDTQAAFSWNTGNHPGSKVIAYDQDVFVSGGLSVAGGTGATPTAVWAVRKTGTAVVIYKNGVSQATGSITATGTANGGISIGWRARESANYLNGFCGEALVYASALSDSDVALNYSYLGNKWAL